MAVSIATEETYREHVKKLRGDVEKRTGKTPEQLYQERQERLWDAIELRQPDRVPVMLGGNYFAARYVGLPYSSLYYDAMAWKTAYLQMLVDFEPDTPGSSSSGGSGPTLEALDTKNVLWPGGTLPADVSNQAVDGEYLKEDEYDLFLEDTTDFIIRRYLPRVYGALAPLAKLPDLSGRNSFPAITPLFTTAEFQELARTLGQAGQEQARYRRIMDKFNEDIARLGFPTLAERGGASASPAFDQMANTYRGWKGIITDMYRRPEKLIAALEKINNKQLAKTAPADPARKGPQLCSGGAIHRGSDRFLSKKQWETFYWPTWKKAMLKCIELGYIVNVFAEGFCENRLEYFLELPKGKVVVKFSDTDMTRAKAVLGSHCCIIGNVPSTLLQMGSPPEIEEYCKKLIKVCGKNGGYILTSDTNAIQAAKPENVRVMVESVTKYGWY